MYAQVEKPKENKSSAAVNTAGQMKSDGKRGFNFVDNRQETVAQRKLQVMANNSPQVSQLRAFQDMVNSSPQAKLVTQLQANINYHTPACGCANCNSETMTVSDSVKGSQVEAASVQMKTDNSSVIQRAFCDHCKRDVVDSDRHNQDCPKFSVRTFQTEADRRAPVLTRSHSFDRLRGRSGSFDRVHEHENKHTGRRFEHVIGHTDRDGNHRGR